MAENGPKCVGFMARSAHDTATLWCQVGLFPVPSSLSETTHLSFSGDPSAEPLSYAVQSPVGKSSAQRTTDNPQFAAMSGTEMMTTVTGSVVTFGGTIDKQVSFTFYEQRDFSPFAGKDVCTFGG
jgi:hypothetical protein